MQSSSSLINRMQPMSFSRELNLPANLLAASALLIYKLHLSGRRPFIVREDEKRSIAEEKYHFRKSDTVVR